MVILFITYPPNIRELNKNIPFVWIYHKHTCKISQCLCYLNSRSPTWPYISFIIFRSSTKNPNIFGHLYFLALVQTIWIKFKWLWIKSLQSCLSYFSWNQRIFASPGILFACANSFPNPLHLSFLLQFCFMLRNEVKEKESREPN